MHYQNLGNTDIKISSIIYGCWQAAWPGTEEAELIAAQQAALDAGVTTFDTAEGYGGGDSERLLAKALGTRRDEIVIATKVGADNLAAEKVATACERSLKNLNTDRIDLYQIHWPAGTWGSDIVPIGETIDALLKLKSAGKIRALGVSNFNKAQMTEAIAVAPIESLQPPYSLFWRHLEEDSMPVCREHGISILAYSPLAQGLLTGKFGRDHKFVPGDPRGGNKLFKDEHFGRVQAALDQLRPIASAHNASLGNLALAWLLHQPKTCPIVGARTAEQARENATATDISLTSEEISKIDVIGKSVTDHLDSNPVMWG